MPCRQRCTSIHEICVIGSFYNAALTYELLQLAYSILR